MLKKIKINKKKSWKIAKYFFLKASSHFLFFHSLFSLKSFLKSFFLLLSHKTQDSTETTFFTFEFLISLCLDFSIDRFDRSLFFFCAIFFRFEKDVKLNYFVNFDVGNVLFVIRSVRVVSKNLKIFRRSAGILGDSNRCFVMFKSQVSK